MVAARREVRARTSVVRFQDEFKNLYQNERPAVSSSKAVELKAADRKAGARRKEKEEKEEQKHAHVMSLRKRSNPVNYADRGRKPAAAPKAEEQEQDKKGKGKAKAKAKEIPKPKKAPLKAKPKPKPKKKLPARRIPLRAPFRFNPAPAAFGFNPAPVVPVVRPLDELLKNEGSPAQKRKAEGQILEWSPEIKPELFDLNLAHLKEVVPPLHEELPLADITSNDLLAILKETDITPEELGHWKAYAGHNLFNSKEDMARNLETVVTYCENDANAGKGIKNKLRLVTKILKDDKEARGGILVMLAQHGGVCHVMKELAVNLAYSMLSNNVKDFLDKQSLKSLVLRHLQTLRELITEEVFVETGNYMNSHPLVAFRNGMSSFIGLDEIPDQHAAKNPADENRLLKFFARYTSQRMAKFIGEAVNDKHRKIPYDTIVDWLKQNSPKEDAYEFLGECFDENGHLTQAAILYILHRLEILV